MQVPDSALFFVCKIAKSMCDRLGYDFKSTRLKKYRSTMQIGTNLRLSSPSVCEHEIHRRVATCTCSSDKDIWVVEVFT